MCFGLVNFPGHFARRLSAISALGVADKQTEIHLDSDSLSKSWRSPTKAYLRKIAWFFNHSQSNCKARVAGDSRDGAGLGEKGLGQRVWSLLTPRSRPPVCEWKGGGSIQGAFVLHRAFVVDFHWACPI